MTCPTLDNGLPCGLPVRAKGLCNKHYTRAWRHGNPQQATAGWMLKPACQSCGNQTRETAARVMGTTVIRERECMTCLRVRMTVEVTIPPKTLSRMAETLLGSISETTPEPEASDGTPIASSTASSVAVS